MNTITLNAEQFFRALKGPKTNATFTFSTNVAPRKHKGGFGIFVSMGNANGEEVTERIPIRFESAVNGETRNQQSVYFTQRKWIGRPRTISVAYLFVWNYAINAKEPYLVFEAQDREGSLIVARTVSAPDMIRIKQGSLVIRYEDLLAQHPEIEDLNHDPFRNNA